MKRLEIDENGSLSYKGQIVQARAVGAPVVFHFSKEGLKDRIASFNEKAAEFVESSNPPTGIEDAYIVSISPQLAGNYVFSAVQFYKLGQ